MEGPKGWAGGVKGGERGANKSRIERQRWPPRRQPSRSPARKNRAWSGEHIVSLAGAAGPSVHSVAEEAGAGTGWLAGRR